MPKFDLSEEEHAAIVALVRRTLLEDRYPLSPRMAPLRAAFAKLVPGPPLPRKRKEPLQPPTGPIVGSRRKPRRDD
jgi:hypothetical protein